MHTLALAVGAAEKNNMPLTMEIHRFLPKSVGEVAAELIGSTRSNKRGRKKTGWAYPWAAGVFVLASLVMVVNAILESPRPSAAGLLIIGAGVPVYWWSKRREEAEVRAGSA